MKFKREGALNQAFIGMTAAALALIVPNLSASPPTGVMTQMVITVQPARQGGAPERLQPPDVMVAQGNTTMPVARLDRLAGDLADMQLFILLDDSTRSAGLGIQLPQLRTFLNSLPATTQTAIGYMQNGTFALAQAFTTDHRKAANALRLPAGIPGENGSPYFALSSLAKHWPSKQSTGRRAVLMLTDGVDRYYDASVMDDPYVDAAVRDTLKNGVAVYSVYLRGAGYFGWSGRVTNFAQSRLIEVSEETGGHAYYEGFGDPVNITPFLNDFHNRLDNQYKLTFAAKDGHGVQAIKLRTELPGIKIEGPSRIYVQ